MTGDPLRCAGVGRLSALARALGWREVASPPKTVYIMCVGQGFQQDCNLHHTFQYQLQTRETHVPCAGRGAHKFTTQRQSPTDKHNRDT